MQNSSNNSMYLFSEDFEKDLSEVGKTATSRSLPRHRYK